MCNVIAVLAKNAEGTGEILRTLLTLGQSRGKDAAGALWLASDGSVCIKKDKGPADTVFKDFAIPDSILHIGHNRQKTQGSPDDNNNNHPVSYGGLHLVHNGTVFSLQDNHTSRRGEVDTGHIVDAIYHLKVDGRSTLDAIVEMGGQIEGHQACVLYDESDPMHVYMWRRVSPLSLSYYPMRNIILATSEFNHALQAMAIATPLLGGLFYDVQEPKHYRYDVGNETVLRISLEDFSDWEATQLKDEPQVKTFTSLAKTEWQACPHCGFFHNKNYDCTAKSNTAKSNSGGQEALVKMVSAKAARPKAARRIARQALKGRFCDIAIAQGLDSKSDLISDEFHMITSRLVTAGCTLSDIRTFVVGLPFVSDQLYTPQQREKLRELAKELTK